jgi:hypothetical protein
MKKVHMIIPHDPDDQAAELIRQNRELLDKLGELSQEQPAVQPQAPEQSDSGAQPEVDFGSLRAARPE